MAGETQGRAAEIFVTVGKRPAVLDQPSRRPRAAPLQVALEGGRSRSRTSNVTCWAYRENRTTAWPAELPPPTTTTRAVRRPFDAALTAAASPAVSPR